MTIRQMAATPEVPLVVVVLVNWNRHLDTIECLESLFVGDYSNMMVVVCDNGSRDDSLGHIARWARGQVFAPEWRQRSPIEVPADRVCPLDYLLLTPEGLTSREVWNFPGRLFLIDAQRNLGFAGAANLGIAFALRNAATRFVWILNNDTIVAPNCLSRMVIRMHRGPTASMCGSRILFYDRPDLVQAFGGARFYSWIGESRMIGFGSNASHTVNIAAVERDLDHLLGASMLVSRPFLEEVGLMEDSYFLYYEEMDWVLRAKGRCKIVYAHDALVYHKVGSSVGTSDNVVTGSALSAYFLTASRLRFTRRFYPMAFPTTVAFCVARAVWAYAHGNRKAASAIVAALCGRRAGAYFE
jgi:GT2 family glycosyltransferase